MKGVRLRFKNDQFPKNGSINLHARVFNESSLELGVKAAH